MSSNKLIIRIIQRKKEVYYSLFSISISYLLCWILILFISFADSQVILPFFFWSLAVLIFKYALDIYHASKKNDESISKSLTFLLVFVSVIINFIVALRLVILVLIDIYYTIPICIYFLASILIYCILRYEIKKYYFRKNKQIIE
ncbi:MAG: hypothetical protein ACFFBV_05700 [Promethearchaeota archaeon]